MPQGRIRIEIGETPRVGTSNPGTAEHQEAHKQKEVVVDERLIEDVRKDIIVHYGIDKKNIIFTPAEGERKREIRAFIIIINKKDNEKKYYADGHTNHATLLDLIFQKFSEIGIPNTHNLPDNFDDNWDIKKGFIDPYNNGFKDFKAIHTRLKEELIQRQPSLGEEIENDKIDLPSWFLS